MQMEHTDTTVARDLWFRHLGITGFTFFLVKGLLWLLVPALIACFR